MPRKPQQAEIETWSPIEREFLEALQRIQSSTPKDRDLAKKAKAGTLKISVASVAKEAGRSRTLIGHDECRYPRVRQRIVAAMKPVIESRTAQDVINRLRENNADLRTQLTLARSQNVALIRRMIALEAAAKREIRRARRDAKAPRQPSFQIAGREFQGGAVVPLREGVKNEDDAD
jgi:hypothetical protein